jgi:hypothetical protein
MEILYPCSTQYLEAGLGNWGVDVTVGTAGRAVGVSFFAILLGLETQPVTKITKTISAAITIEILRAFPLLKLSNPIFPHPFTDAYCSYAPFL